MVNLLLHSCFKISLLSVYYDKHPLNVETFNLIFELVKRELDLWKLIKLWNHVKGYMLVECSGEWILWVEIGYTFLCPFANNVSFEVTHNLHVISALVLQGMLGLCIMQLNLSIHGLRLHVNGVLNDDIHIGPSMDNSFRVTGNLKLYISNFLGLNSFQLIMNFFSKLCFSCIDIKALHWLLN